MIAVAATGALTRLRTLPVPVCLAASLAGLLLYLNLIFEARHSLLRVIPTPPRSAGCGTWRAPGCTTRTGTRRRSPPARPAAAGRGRGRHHRGAGRPDRGPAAVHRAGRAAATGAVHRAGHHQRPAQPAHHRGGVLPGRGGLPGHAQRRRPGTDPGLGPPGLAVAVGAAVRPDPRPGLGLRGTGSRSRRALGRPDTRALAAAGRRVGLASIVLALCAAAARARPAPEQAVLLRPRHRRQGRRGGDSLSLPSALAQTVNQLHESQPFTVFTYTTNAPAGPAGQTRNTSGSTCSTRWPTRAGRSTTTPRVRYRSILPGPQGLTDTTASQLVKTTVTVSRDFPGPGRAGLPAAALSGHQVTAPGKWLADPELMVYSTSDPIAGRSYTVASLAVDPSQAQLSSLPALPRRPASHRAAAAVAYQTQALKQLADAQHARPDHRVRQGGRAGELAIRPRVQLQPLHGPSRQRLRPAELPDQEQVRLLRAVRLRDDRADPAARHPGPVRGRLHGGTR